MRYAVIALAGFLSAQGVLLNAEKYFAPERYCNQEARP